MSDDSKWLYMQADAGRYKFNKELMWLPDGFMTTLHVWLTFNTQFYTAYIQLMWSDERGDMVEVGKPKNIEWEAALRLLEISNSDIPKELQ